LTVAVAESHLRLLGPHYPLQELRMHVASLLEPITSSSGRADDSLRQCVGGCSNSSR
jgi:hypothetical protein